MPSISIITPWHGETGFLLADYYQAVSGSAQVISIDNACPPPTADALKEMTEHLTGVYIRNDTNTGFAAANNQGYAKATGDIIVFLNSDVAPAGPWLHQVCADVRDGALYGPALAAQLVAGRHVPYIEGWCVAGTRKTWERIRNDPFRDERMAVEQGLAVSKAAGGWQGPWDALAYPGPYWEDNDLCLRAMQRGLSLVQTAWQISHKGGQTAGPIIRHGKSFAQNEATFTGRVLAALREPQATDLWQRYMQAYYTQSDIQHHLGLLFSLARGNVVELGTRTGVSTSALLAGVEAHGGHVTSIDLEDCSALFDHPQWAFIQGDSRDPKMATRAAYAPTIDLLLIDTEHTYEIASAELALWGAYMAPGGRILLHDPETFPGVRRAIVEFCAAKGWPVTFILPCNGMAIVEVPHQPDASGLVSTEGAAWAMEEGRA